MVALMKSLQDWNTPAFEQSLKGELAALGQGVLPLQQVVGRGNRVYDADLGVTLLESSADENTIQARVGIFFAEVIACVSCGEGDPIDEAYCEMQVTIDKANGESQFSVYHS